MSENNENNEKKKVKVGVYVCHCGGNISDTINVKEVAESCGKCAEVTVAKDYAFMCSDPGQNLIIEDIRSGKVDRVVVAACSPALHELTFRKALKRGGLNPYLYDHVNIREQASWVHKSDKAGATKKAKALLAAGVAKVSLQDPLFEITSEARAEIIIIGAGPSGIKAAIGAASMGLKVHLIEKEETLGGKLKDLDLLYPYNQKASDLLDSLLKELENYSSSIKIYTKSFVKDIKGFVGNFEIFLSGGEKIYAGAIIMATGMKNYIPEKGEMGYEENSKVMTLPDFQKKIKEGTLDLKKKKIGFAYCVGSRCEKHDYCSRLCCTQSLHTSSLILEKYPEAKVFHFYQDIRTYGRGHEDIYEKNSKLGALFFRYASENPPELTKDGIIVQDILTWNERLEVPLDLIILVTGVEPSPIDELVSMLKLPRGADHFLQEAHPKLRPVELANNGIYLAGACQAPMDLKESSAGARAAVSKALCLLSPGIITLEPFLARVDESKCKGTGKCLDECSYVGAIQIDESTKKAKITPALCKGCGACAAVCPERAIQVAGWSLDQFDAMVSAIAKGEV